MAFKAGDIGLRAASAIVLAPAAVLAIWAGGLWFLALMLLACTLLAVEWAMMSAAGAWRVMAGAVAFGLVAGVVAAHAQQLSLALVMLVFGAVAAGLFARNRGQEALDAAYGVLYLGWPAVLLIWLRDVDTATGLAWTVSAFVIAWAADIMAYLVGSLVGGPKLWPRFSPNKTWSGFIGGLAAGTAAGAALAAFLHMGIGPLWGAALGLAAALATMGGDLWESALKRRYGVKDAGKLIPGHGGLLDRVDGLMFAVVVVAAGRLIVGLLGAGA
ncbi:MAG: phosphatidate cytidylyltransferase [Brevundimonas sp.]|uniref:phosphatidate cytidylyltransferase n=1 Tax=Alphaproteobacteria TaxID=28211 RepID=UPI002726B22D|nr:MULTISPECIES: phosphatidate cytidylyltransferase [Alphaproteobacteria]MDO9586322.1 phosphatidate cytidylyltransferase [Brevundimonas sp.]MDP3368628.1 phosphatidate cytidylyltransferase [Brevundimonas sp.]MDP3693895.1 phosphatidate cytidylyltransferase [Bradyrhizobium sp.]MDZ4110033.1 phosphatidate cytidylyltransferase [Brevundimonas sp.]